MCFRNKPSACSQIAGVSVILRTETVTKLYYTVTNISAEIHLKFSLKSFSIYIQIITHKKSNTWNDSIITCWCTTSVEFNNQYLYNYHCPANQKIPDFVDYTRILRISRQKCTDLKIYTQQFFRTMTAITLEFTLFETSLEHTLLQLQNKICILSVTADSPRPHDFSRLNSNSVIQITGYLSITKHYQNLEEWPPSI